MVLFETRYRPDQIDSDNKAVLARHTGMALFALCDGSVRVIGGNIDTAVYNAVGTVGGGESSSNF